MNLYWHAFGNGVADAIADAMLGLLVIACMLVPAGVVLAFIHCAGL